MCNAFNTAQKTKKIPLPFGGNPPDSLSDEPETRLIRRTDSTPVILPDGTLTEMRWGFQRKGLGVINNTRSDNLESPVWKESFARRPCLIPLISYYEWSGPKGHKRTHLFRSAAQQWLYAAGLWEPNTELGDCASMLTTDANDFVSPIHHRMPAFLDQERQNQYLSQSLSTLEPSVLSLEVNDALNPLLKNPPRHTQGELF